MIQLRGFQRRDLAGLHQLDGVCFSPEIAYSKAELRYFLTHPSCSCWIAERPENKLAGFVIIERASATGAWPATSLPWMSTRASAAADLGTLLMQTAEEQMKHEGVAVMSLEVAENNAVARRFYRGLGYTISGRIAKYYGGRVDAEVMEKMILLRGL